MTPQDRIEGWKGIAAHFGRGVRTVQRWEKDLAMPVHRLGTGRGEVVFAFPEELDGWFASAETRRATEDDAPQPQVEGAESADARPGPRPRQLAWFVVTASALMTLATLGAWIATRPQDSGAAVRNPVSLRVENDALIVDDGEGRELWRWRFSGRLDSRLYPFQPNGVRLMYLIRDVDGDLRPEVLFVIRPSPDVSVGEEGVYLFGPDGGPPRFHYRPEHRVEWGDYRAAPPWQPAMVAVSPADWPRGSIWLASVNVYFPAVLERIGLDGRSQARYWSDGHISCITFARSRGRRVVLVGGANNEFKGGSLAMFDAESSGGTAPAVNPKYVCQRGCEPGEPLGFFVWPRSAVYAALDGAEGTEPILNVSADEAGQIQVGTGSHAGVNPGRPAGTPFLGGERLCILDDWLRPVSAELSGTYAEAYAYLRGLHPQMPPYDARPDSHLYPMYRWEGGGFVRMDGPVAALRTARRDVSAPHGR